LDAKEASVGGEADLPQRGQIHKMFPDVEVPTVVDGGLGAQRSAFRRVAPDDCSSGAP
jgi:thiazole synthase ThiGH ThiG subunit